MIYTIGHGTTYAYEKPVGFARCVLRLTPASSNSQRLLSSVVTVSPQPASLVVGRGAFGEQTRTIVIDKPHDKLVIEARSRVDVDAHQVEAAGSPAWVASAPASRGRPGGGLVRR